MKFNKNKCFFASVYVAAVSAMTFTGFTSYAAEQNAQINETLSLIRGEEIQWGVSEIVQNAQKTTVEETLTAVNEAKSCLRGKAGRGEKGSRRSRADCPGAGRESGSTSGREGIAGIADLL